MKNKLKFNNVIFTIYVILNAVFAFQVIKLNTLPAKYNIILLIAQVLVVLLFYYGVFKNKSKALRGLSKFFVIFISIALLITNGYIYRFGSVLGKVAGGDTMTDTVSIIVKKDSSYQSIEDVKDLDFGVEDDHSQLIDNAIAKFSDRLNHEISVVEVKDHKTLVESLMINKFEVIIINEAYRNIILDDYPEFNEETRVLDTNVEVTEITRRDVNVTKDTFAVLISGIDVYGSISNNSRSDVNILAVVNPVEKKIVLVSVPRDYYVPMACKNNAMDKLTHTGIYGVNCTMDTLGNVFGIDIDFYARVNFSSLINVVDALGGVTVYNGQAFSAGGYNFPAGENYLNGEKSLVFVRDRYHQSDGDSGRGRNQVKVLTAIINKVASPALITNFNSLLASIEGSFQTNLSTSEINSLVKMQINDLATWDITQEQVSGTGTYDYSYALGGNYYMMHPDYASVNRVVEIINTLY